MVSPGHDQNRVAPTAWGVSYLRTFSDIPFAQEFFDALNTNIQANGGDDIATVAFRDNLAPQLEARYKLVDTLILSAGNDQVLELAAGMATHGINMSRANPALHYVELDLPDVISEKRAVFESIGLTIPASLRLEAGDALNENDIHDAITDFASDRPITIVNEGLMRYLNFAEKTTLASIIHKILRKYGGAWVTPDISLKQALSREDEVSAGHVQRLKQTTGIDIDKNLFENAQQAEEYFGNLGFSVELHSYSEVAEQLVSPKRLGMSDEAVRRLNEPCVAFVMTAM